MRLESFILTMITGSVVVAACGTNNDSDTYNHENSHTWFHAGVGAWLAPSGSYTPETSPGEIWIPPSGPWQFDGHAWYPPSGLWRSSHGQDWLPQRGRWRAPAGTQSPAPGLWLPPPNQATSTWGWTFRINQEWNAPSGSYNDNWYGPSGSYNDNWYEPDNSNGNSNATGGWYAPSGAWIPVN